MKAYPDPYKFTKEDSSELTLEPLLNDLHIIYVLLVHYVHQQWNATEVTEGKHAKAKAKCMHTLYTVDYDN